MLTWLGMVFRSAGKECVWFGIRFRRVHPLWGWCIHLRGRDCTVGESGGEARQAAIEAAVSCKCRSVRVSDDRYQCGDRGCIPHDPAQGTGMVCELRAEEQLRDEAVLRVGAREQAMHGGGGDEHPVEGADRATLWRSERRVGQSFGYNSRRIFCAASAEAHLR